MKKIIKFIILLLMLIILHSHDNYAQAQIQSCGSTGPCTIRCPDKCPKESIDSKEKKCVCAPAVGTTINPGGDNTTGVICNPVLNYVIGCGQGEDVIARLLAGIIRLFFVLGSIATLLWFLWGGLSWITAGGDKGQLEIARNRITSAFIGIVIIASTYAVLVLLGSVLGIDFFKSLVINWPTLVPQ